MSLSRIGDTVRTVRDVGGTVKKGDTGIIADIVQTGKATWPIHVRMNKTANVVAFAWEELEPVIVPDFPWPDAAIGNPHPKTEAAAQVQYAVTPESLALAKHDPVNHPEHYTDGGIETIDFIEAKGLGYHVGNAVKYLSRAGKKNKDPRQDLQKAAWYIRRELERLDG